MQLHGGGDAGKRSSSTEEGTLCLYPSKPCNNPRVLKSNGQLHKFCQLHRDKANYNQRQLQYKRTAHPNQAQGSPSQLNLVQTKGPHLLPKPARINDDEFELDEEDVRLIEKIAAADVAQQNSQE
ncbi:hypothetical protein PHMEG_00013719 [Phytophthora megakarya]|uniref:Uncharacterized protein n=1 Tax=Phytophthora megakarya TaxID=4795 RepID=A0A225W5L5_9STRA|nr:hypothetical protein PHMEG_00013719 [Phytophthora megakarya]